MKDLDRSRRRIRWWEKFRYQLLFSILILIIGVVIIYLFQSEPGLLLGIFGLVIGITSLLVASNSRSISKTSDNKMQDISDYLFIEKIAALNNSLKQSTAEYRLDETTNNITNDLDAATILLKWASDNNKKTQLINLMLKFKNKAIEGLNTYKDDDSIKGLNKFINEIEKRRKSINSNSREKLEIEISENNEQLINHEGLIGIRRELKEIKMLLIEGKRVNALLFGFGIGFAGLGIAIGLTITSPSWSISGSNPSQYSFILMSLSLGIIFWSTLEIRRNYNKTVAILGLFFMMLGSIGYTVIDFIKTTIVWLNNPWIIIIALLLFLVGISMFPLSKKRKNNIEAEK